MREMIFRGMDINNNWCYGYLLIIGEKCKYNNLKDGVYIIGHDTDGLTVAHAVRPETVGQYTGLMDRCSDDIYEDDILQILKKGEPRQISFYYGMFCCPNGLKYDNFAKHPYRNPENIKIIGNKHENPEIFKFYESGKDNC